MPFKVEGIDYTPEGIENLRQELIKYRDAALKQAAFEETVVLSHTIALLAYLIERERELV